MMIDINKLYSNRLSQGDVINKVRVNNDPEEKKILDFSSEKNTLKTDGKIINMLCEEIKNNRSYDLLEFNKSCSAYMRVEQSVDLDYKSEITYCNGVKETLNLLSLAFINKDDYVITTSPGDNTIGSISKWLDCKVYKYNLSKFNNYLIDFEDIDEAVLRKCKLLYINYPNNPTGMVANKEFFKEVIKYARKYNFIVIHDASYLDLCFEDIDKISFLSVEGSKDVGVELYSISQIMDVINYEVGFIAGNKDIIKAFEIIRNNINSTEFPLIKRASVEVLNNYERISSLNKQIYLRRHKLIKEKLEKSGFKVEVPKAGFYQYIEIPKSCNGVTFESAQEFALWLLNNENINVTSFDNEGKYIRISMDFSSNDEQEEKLIAEALENRLKKYKFEFI